MCPAEDRLNQGPFGVEQDDGWHTLTITTPARGQVRNFGMGLIGYPWEENGAPPVPGESLEETVRKLAELPFCDKLYIRCDWRDVQRRPGRLDLNPVFPIAFELAKKYGIYVGIRMQMSSPNIFPELAMPKFLAKKIPFVDIGPIQQAQEKAEGPLHGAGVSSTRRSRRRCASSTSCWRTSSTTIRSWSGWTSCSTGSGERGTRAGCRGIRFRILRRRSRRG